MSNCTSRRVEKSERLSSASETASAGASSSNRRTSASPSASLAAAFAAASSTKNSTSPVIRITEGAFSKEGISASEKGLRATRSVYVGGVDHPINRLK